MTEQTPISASDSRDSLRARIEAAERRNAERSLADNARDAATAAIDYTRANPLTVIGGALALGLIIGLLTRPGRRLAGRVVESAGDAVGGAASNATAGAKRVAERGGVKLGTLIGEAAMGYVMTMIDEALDAARTGQERAGELGDAASAQARKISSGAADVAGNAAQGSKKLARKTRAAAAGAVRDLTRKTKG